MLSFFRRDSQISITTALTTVRIVVSFSARSVASTSNRYGLITAPTSTSMRLPDGAPRHNSDSLTQSTAHRPYVSLKGETGSGRDCHIDDELVMGHCPTKIMVPLRMEITASWSLRNEKASEHIAVHKKDGALHIHAGGYSPFHCLLYTTLPLLFLLAYLSIAGVHSQRILLVIQCHACSHSWCSDRRHRSDIAAHRVVQVDVAKVDGAVQPEEKHLGKGRKEGR